MAQNSTSRSPRLAPSRILGLALVAVGAILLVLSYDAQSSIDELGAQTTDPVLKERVAMFEQQRDLFLVSSLGTLFIGFFALAILGEPSLPTTVPSEQMVSTARLASGLISGLSLDGNSTFLPAKHGLTQERMLVSAKGTGELPVALSDDLVMSPGRDGSTPAVVLEPLGIGLLDHLQRELGISLADAGIEAAEGGLQTLKHGLGLMKDFHLKERGGKTILRVEYSGLAQACASVRKERPDVCRQVPCLGCSCILTAVARASGRAVTVSEVDNSQDTVVFTLELRDW